MYYIVIIGECKIINSSISVNKCPSIGILAVTTSNTRTHTRFRNICHVDFSALINTFVLLQFDGPQMIPRIEIGSMFPCLRISFSVYTSLSTLVTLIVCDCRTNFISSLFTTMIQIEKMTSRADVFIVARKAKSLRIQNASYRVGQLWCIYLTAKELEYILKIILLREFKKYIDQLWDRLSKHIKTDSADSATLSMLETLQFALLSIAY